ncbi:MAG TPA: ABC transporter ATP-binding protein [Tepidisphaeraceae bacterium]|jgi:iron complex transport system ATP-binding protein|nr:ABC transporter ATP-binding protein [Tepidisphaeraceae bacterium]
MSNPMSLLTATNLTFGYRDTPVLRGVSVALAPGEIVALIGPNGSGKSTLIRALLGHVIATGQIDWNGRPLADWPKRELARTVAYLPQSPVYDVDQTVLDVLRLGRSPYLGAFGIESAADVQVVHEVATQLGLTDLLTRSMDELSGGQRQRVFVGRCLVQQPTALLLDEPNTFLDLKHQAELVSLARTLSRERNMGVLIASHDLNLAAAVADRLVLLKDGAVVATGVPDEVLRADVLSAAFETPLRRVDGARIAIIPEFTSM